MSAQREVPVIGIIGGVGSGKSAIARELAARRSIVIVDGDQAGHQVLLDRTVKERLHQRFGAAVFDQQGEVIRSALARLVFGPAQHQRQARTDLERIVHPEIEKLLAQQIQRAKSNTRTEAVLLDAAVLVEAGWHDLCDAVVFVDTPEPIRRNRVLATRRWTAEQFRQREESQLPLDQKRRRADFVIDNSGSLPEAAAELARVVDQVVNRRKSQVEGR